MRKGMLGLLAASLLPLFALAEEWTDSRGITWTYYVADTFPTDGIGGFFKYPNGVRIEGAKGAEAIKGTLVFPDEINSRPVISLYNLEMVCTNVTAVVFPKGLQVISGGYLKVGPGVSAIEFPRTLIAISCGWSFWAENLEEAVLNDGLEYLQWPFYFCRKLQTIDIPETVVDLVGRPDDNLCRVEDGFTIMDGWVVDWDGTGKPNVQLPDGCIGLANGSLDSNLGLATNRRCIFVSTRDTEGDEFSITFPEGFKYVSINALCIDGLKISGLNFPSTLKRLGRRALSGCHLLQSLTISSGEIGAELLYDYCGWSTPYRYLHSGNVVLGEGVTSIGERAFSSLFNRCNGIKLPNSVTNFYASSFYDAFSLDLSDNTNYCYETEQSIRTLYRVVNSEKVGLIATTTWDEDLPDEFVVPDTVRFLQEDSLYGMFGFDNDYVLRVKLPLGIESFGGCDDNLFAVGYGVVAVYQDIYEENGMTWRYLKTDEGVKLTGVTGASGKVVVPTKIGGVVVTGIGNYLFNNCSNVTEIVFGDGVTSIGDGVFDGCANLTEIVFGEGVSSIGNDVFEGCENIRNLYFRGDEPECGSVYDISDLCATVHIPLDANWPNVKTLRYDESGIEYWRQIMPIERFDAKVPTVVPGEAAAIETGFVGYKAKGLPSGLKYDAKTGKITGAATKPTGDAGAVVTFTKKGAADETLTIVVTAIPTVSVTMTGDTEKCKVTGAGAYLVGKKVSLSATAPKGTAFVGWFADDVAWPNETDSKKAKLSYVMTKVSIALTAKFETEKMSVACAGLSAGGFIAGVAGAADGIPLEIETQSGVKSVKVSKLPKGMTYDAKKGRITGAPTQTGTFKVLIEVTAVSGAVKKEEIEIAVAAPDAGAVGTFNGFVTDDSLQEINKVGSLQLVTTDAGKITAKVVTADGSYSFAATGWDGTSARNYGGGLFYDVTMTTKKGETLQVSVCAVGMLINGNVIGADWYDNQVDGWLTLANKKQYRVSAQKNVFGRPWYFTAKGSEAEGWTLSNAADTKSADITITVKDGATTLAGKIGGYKVSSSGVVNMSSYAEGILKASFTPVVTVGNTKKVLVIDANLRYDRLDQDCGTAGFGR